MSAFHVPRLAPDIGNVGTLDGREQRVEGLARLRTEGLDLYQWTEYRLTDGAGRERTLVSEPEGNGLAWRLFESAEVTPTMREIMEKGPRIGQTWDFRGRKYRIDYTGQSRVVGIEATPPAGYRLNQVDRFFNSLSDDMIVVVSRDEKGKVSCYEGRTLFPGVAESAFHLDPPASWQTFERNAEGSHTRSGRGFSWLTPAFYGFVFAASVALRVWDNFEPDVEFLPAPAKQTQPWGPLKASSLFTDDGRRAELVGTRSVEVRRPGPWADTDLAWFKTTEGELLFACRGIPFSDGRAYGGRRLTVELPPARAAEARPDGIIQARGVAWTVRSVFQLVPTTPNPSAVVLAKGLTTWQGLIASHVTEGTLLLIWNDQALVAYQAFPLSDLERERLWPSRL